MYKNKTITCQDCGTAFEFSVQEQEFYAEKGFTNEPTRCRDCRAARKNNNSRQTEREMYPAVCASCGVQTQVPFKPSTDKPVYCRDCFSRKNR